MPGLAASAVEEYAAGRPFQVTVLCRFGDEAALALTIVDASLTMVDLAITIIVVSLTMVDLAVTIVDASLTMVELAVTIVDASLTMVEMAITIVDASLTMVELAITIVDASLTMVDLAVTMVDVSLTMVDLAVTIVDASLTKVDLAVTIVDASLTKVDLAVTIVDASLTMVELAITMVDVPLTMVEPSLATSRGGGTFEELVLPPMTDSATLALICSVPFEGALLRGCLAETTETTVGRKVAWSGTLDGCPILLLPAGMGKTNAAQGLTALLETRSVRGVIGFGVGGAYPDSGLALGDVALASACIYGDEGVETPAGWISTEGIGIPLLERGGSRVFNEMTLDPELVEHARAVLQAAGIVARVGPFVTVSACSGTTARGEVLTQRFGALCEGMEGAALAHVASLYEVPFLELRAVSNAVEDRDLSRWRLAEAAEAAQRAVRVVAADWKNLVPER